MTAKGNSNTNAENKTEKCLQARIKSDTDEMLEGDNSVLKELASNHSDYEIDELPNINVKDIDEKDDLPDIDAEEEKLNGPELATCLQPLDIKLLDELDDFGGSVMIMGDFNEDILKGKAGIQQCMEKNFYKQCVTEVTTDDIESFSP
ncbi:hypothetical protein SNE40_019909 [Patella caerulea]|uniref:Uncharacterized protein n=1 Tax=Patella caerulea TaxID=87958 RepID=A0AAN8G1Q6_PATCE